MARWSIPPSNATPVCENRSLDASWLGRKPLSVKGILKGIASHLLRDACAEKPGRVG